MHPFIIKQINSNFNVEDHDEVKSTNFERCEAYGTTVIVVSRAGQLVFIQSLWDQILVNATNRSMVSDIWKESQRNVPISCNT